MSVSDECFIDLGEKKIIYYERFPETQFNAPHFDELHSTGFDGIKDLLATRCAINQMGAENVFFLLEEHNQYIFRCSPPEFIQVPRVK